MLVSIIIITLNEVENLKDTILAVRQASQIRSDYSIPVEIIVSDGGSNDGTIELAKEFADKLVLGSPSRYKQLNRGAKSSKGDVLIFLHADTILPKNGIIEILHNLKDQNIIGGAFKKKWKWSPNVKRSQFLRFVSYLWQSTGNWLVRFFKSFPADNAIFVRRKIFQKMNGFSPLWICEGFDFIRRLKKFGRRRVICLLLSVYTSARRFEKYGFFRILFTWFFIYWMWWLGMSSDRLKIKFNKYSSTTETVNKTYIRL
jgi:glycosyltransferase involved in cell wall biosynthesis